MKVTTEYDRGFRAALIEVQRGVRDAHEAVVALDLGEPPGRARAAALAVIAGMDQALDDLLARKCAPGVDPPAQERALAEAVIPAAEARQIARQKGYTGDACGECGGFTLVRNGSCLKCDACGATTGCS